MTGQILIVTRRAEKFITEIVIEVFQCNVQHGESTSPPCMLTSQHRLAHGRLRKKAGNDGTRHSGPCGRNCQRAIHGGMAGVAPGCEQT